MSNDNDSEDLKILLNPIIEYTDGLQWVHHVNDISDFKKQDYLELTKGMGRIIYSEWCQRYNHSRNLYLFQGSMKTGDWFINLDSLEILKPDFFKKWGFLKELLENNNIDGVVLYGKRFLYRFSEFLEHKGNPHEYIVGNNTTIELTTIQEFSNTDWFWGSRRSEKRNEFHFVLHYLKYYCLPNSNHCLLGCENNIEKYKEQEYALNDLDYIPVKQKDRVNFEVIKIKIERI